MDLSVGDIAPEVKIIISHEQQFALSSLRGKNVVLYFYPKDNTPGCTIEAKAFESHIKDFADLNTIVIGVSKDTQKSHDKFRSNYNLTFDLAVDEDTQICQAYGVLAQKSMFGKKYMGINRTTFLINKEGKIAYIWKDVSVFGHVKEVLDVIKRL